VVSSIGHFCCNVDDAGNEHHEVIDREAQLGCFYRFANASSRNLEADEGNMKILKDESGNVLVLAALSMTMLLSFLAFAVDVGNLFWVQRKLQTLADAAAMAGAMEASACASGSPNCAVVQSAATTALTEATPSVTATLFTQCATASGSGILLTVNNGPCALGSSDPNNGSTSYVEAVVSEQESTFFARVFGVDTVTVSARAEAGKATASPCLIVTGTTGQTVTFNSGGNVSDATGSTCGIWVNSSSAGTCLGGTPAVMEDSGATVDVGSYDIHGNVCDNGGSYTPTPTTGSSTVPDPFAAEVTAGTLVVPTTTGMTTYTPSPIGSNTTLSPGYYPSGFTGNGGTYTITMSAGVYYFGGPIVLGGTATLSGSGVTIYLGTGGSLTMNSATVMNLSAPTTGNQQGMLIWQSATNSNAMILDSATTASWKGAIYVPDAQVTLNGGSSAVAYGMVVVQSLMMDSAMTLSCTSMPGGVCPGGGSGGSGSATVALAE
jgi:Flp pilus assembly protein TadG